MKYLLFHVGKSLNECSLINGGNVVFGNVLKENVAVETRVHYALKRIYKRPSFRIHHFANGNLQVDCGWIQSLFGRGGGDGHFRT